MFKKTLSLCLIFLFLFSSIAKAEVFTPPIETRIEKVHIDYAESIWAEITWDTTRSINHNEILLKLPRVNASYKWLIEKDVGQYPGIKVNWTTVYLGEGGLDLLLNVSEEVGYYISLINESGQIIASDTYIYYPESGINYIPPEDRIFASVDEEGNITGFYDINNMPVDIENIDSILFPNKYVIFSDISNFHWAYDVIYKLTILGYVKGYPDGTFRPNNDITRAEFAAVFANLLKDKYPEGSVYDNQEIFAGLPASHWSHDVVYQLMSFMTKEDALKIFGQEFKPDQKISREEVVAVIHAVLKNNGAFKGTSLRTDEFKDTLNSQFTVAITFCASNDFIVGYPDGTFKPENKITRAEIAALMIKITEKL